MGAGSRADRVPARWAIRGDPPGDALRTSGRVADTAGEADAPRGLGDAAQTSANGSSTNGVAWWK